MKINKVSIVIAAFNEESYIKRCVESVLEQSYSCFELIVVNDYSNDRTEEILKSIKDDRLIYVHNSKREGIAYSRNVGTIKANTEYIFYTDADCMPAKYWLQEGVSTFEKKECAGVEGRTCYETSWASITDAVIENFGGGTYITCNMAYRKSVLKKAGYFNQNYKFAGEDIDLALKVLKSGTIEFIPSMLVFHQRKRKTIKKYFQDVFRVFSKIKYIKNTKNYDACFWKIFYPAHLAFILFPPLLIFRYRIVSLKELFLLPLIYLSYIFERILIWIAAARELIFLL